MMWLPRDPITNIFHPSVTGRGVSQSVSQLFQPKSNWTGISLLERKRADNDKRPPTMWNFTPTPHCTPTPTNNNNNNESGQNFYLDDETDCLPWTEGWWCIRSGGRRRVLLCPIRFLQPTITVSPTPLHTDDGQWPGRRRAGISLPFHCARHS